MNGKKTEFCKNVKHSEITVNQAMKQSEVTVDQAVK